MARFDRRALQGVAGDDAQTLKMPKNKKKKAAPQISPLNTHVNSRSGSEGRKVDPDDDPSDSRSNSGSGRASGSRDITPSTHYSSTVPELSERERKKLAKEEEMFRRQEEEQTGKQRGKKRNSGGSTLHTPSDPKPKQSGFGSSRGYVDAGTSKQSGMPSKPGRKPKGTPKPPPKTITRIVKRPTPNYSHSSVQCDMDKEEAEARPPARSPRRPYMSLTTRLLQRCALNNTRRQSQTSSSSQASKSSPSATMDVDPASPHSPLAAEPVRMPEVKDAEMRDAACDEKLPPEAGERHGGHLINGDPGNDSPRSSLPVNPPAPPWPSQPSHTSKIAELPCHQSDQQQKPPDMHISMPPPSSNGFGAPSALLTSDSFSTTPNSITGTPVSALPPSLVSQSSNAASPMKKKMSLSDYTKRSKAKDKENVDAEPKRESSPASTASGPVVPPLQAQGSERTNENAVEDVSMEDAGPASTVS